MVKGKASSNTGKSILQRSSRFSFCSRQVACADVILLNKIDLVSPDELSSIENIIRQVNPSAPLHRTIKGDIPIKTVLNLQAYSSVPHLESIVHQHDDACDHDETQPNHYEVRGVSSIAVACPPLTSIVFNRLDEWIRSVTISINPSLS